MSEASSHLVYAWEQWEIDLGRRELRSGGAPVPLGSRAFEVVEVLVRSASELVTKDHLMDRVWPGAFVGENTLHVHISAVRKALGRDRHLLKTAQGRGYRLLGRWTANQRAATAPPPPPRRLATAAPPTNCPATVAPLVGRAEAVQRVRDLVSAYRVVTLTGPGGIGKTSLALEAIRGLLGDFEHGVWLVELASLADADRTASAVASVLELKLGGDRVTADSLARALRDKHLLLLLDNCEHLIDAAANLVETVVQHCPRVAVVTTSREVMRVQGECVYRVPPLAVPEPGQHAPDHILGHSAVELFLTRARALDAAFAASADELPSVAEICRHLDGMPLAIHFAAARAAYVGIRQVASGLRDRFALLTQGQRGALPRHRTLRAALDWSYDMLPAGEALLLRHLAVFPAGFTIAAAAAVARDTGLDPSHLPEGIANLVAKSLVALDNSDDAVSRWYLLETIRAYALEKLAAHAELDAAAGRHAGYFRDLFSHLVSRDITRVHDADWARHVRDIDNVRAALDWCFAGGEASATGIELTAAYAPVWLSLSLVGECRERCERALAALDRVARPDVLLRMRLRIYLGIAVSDTTGPAALARELLTGALDDAVALDDIDAQAQILANLVANYIFQTEHGKARAAAERLGQVAIRIGHPVILQMSDRLLGTALVMLGRPREGQHFLERVLAAPRPAADRLRLLGYPQNHPAAARAFLARALWVQGRIDTAWREALASLEELQATDQRLLVCRVLYFGICRIAPSTGDFAAAAHSIARLTDAATTLNAPFWQIAGRFLAGKLMIEQGDYAPGVAALRDAFETCQRTGWRMSYPEFKGALATGLLARGEPAEALAAVQEGLAGASQGADGRDLYVADLHRIHGEVLLQLGQPAAAEAAFREALGVARQQEALWWEVRAALGFARLRLGQGRGDAARQLLAPVYDRFTEAFETPDLRAAKAFLDALPR